jgi:transcriptional regulator with PAS, ATPase and Fis domain
MTRHAWVREFPAAFTVCNSGGTIIEMNAKAVQTFAKDGGQNLVGRNVLDCHPEPARAKLKAIMETQKTNVYTIEKAGIKKLVYQAPWYTDGKYAGVVEISLEIPFDLPHFSRD